MGNSLPTSRYPYVDAMKALAIILVVLGHVLAGCKTETLNWEDMAVWKFIYSFHMPLFMFVSGFVCFSPAKKYSSQKILYRVMSYMLPFFVMGYLVGLLRGEYRYNLYWYFLTLTIFMLLLWCLTSISAKVLSLPLWLKNIVIVFAFVGISYALKFAGKHNDMVAIYFDTNHLHMDIYFIAGWLLRQYPSLDKYCSNRYMLTVSFALMVIMLQIDVLHRLFPFVMILLAMNLCSLDMICKSKQLLQIGGGYFGNLHFASDAIGKDTNYGRSH